MVVDQSVGSVLRGADPEKPAVAVVSAMASRAEDGGGVASEKSIVAPEVGPASTSPLFRVHTDQE